MSGGKIVPKRTLRKETPRVTETLHSRKGIEVVHPLYWLVLHRRVA